MRLNVTDQGLQRSQLRLQLMFVDRRVLFWNTICCGLSFASSCWICELVWTYKSTSKPLFRFHNKTINYPTTISGIFVAGNFFFATTPYSFFSLVQLLAILKAIFLQDICIYHLSMEGVKCCNSQKCLHFLLNRPAV